MIILLLSLLVIASWIYWLAAAILSYRFFHQPQQIPDGPVFPVSILKPVKGLDVEAYENFASFCRQDYPVYEVLFGVADAHDPVIPVIEKLQQDFPQVAIRLVIASAALPNRKVALLSVLSREARYPILAVSDSDMRARPDYLRRVVAPLHRPDVGLVTCPYRGSRPDTLTARLETLYIGVTFLPSMIVARKVIKMRFAMGASIILRKTDLEQIGGYTAIGSYLADDYELGNRIAKTGKSVWLSDFTLDTILGPTVFSDQWEREVRWSHCNQVSRPLQYPGLIISFSIPLAIILAALTDFQPWALLMLAGSLALRWSVGFLVSGWTEDKESRRWLFLLPIRDALTALVWCGGLVGRRVIWRKEVYTLKRGGILMPVPPKNPTASHWSPAELVREGVHLLDATLRRIYGIFQYNLDDENLFRLSTHPAREALHLDDGFTIHVGDEVAILHFWNEHMPAIPVSGADMAWGRKFYNQMERSLHELALYTASSPRMRDVVGFHGIPPWGSDGLMALPPKMLKRWGFELVKHDLKNDFLSRFGRFWENFYVMALIWAYNPASLRGKHPFELGRDEVWITRKALLERYLEKPNLDRQATPGKDGHADGISKGIAGSVIDNKVGSTAKVNKAVPLLPGSKQDSPSQPHGKT